MKILILTAMILFVGFSIQSSCGIESQSTAPDWEAKQFQLETKYRPEFVEPKSGAIIAITLKQGNTLQGTLKAITEKNVQIQMGAATVTFVKEELSKASLKLCYAADFARIKAEQQINIEKANFQEKQRKIQRKQKEAEERKQYDKSLTEAEKQRDDYIDPAEREKKKMEEEARLRQEAQAINEKAQAEARERMERERQEQKFMDLFWTWFRAAMIWGALVTGGLCGLLPLLVGVWRKKTALGFTAFVACLVGGSILGIILALPIAIIMTVIIAVKQE